MEAHLCKAFALWTFHERDVLIRLVEVGPRIRGIAGHIGGELVYGKAWRSKCDGRGLWESVLGTSEGVHGRGRGVGEGGGREEPGPEECQILKGERAGGLNVVPNNFTLAKEGEGN